MNFIKLINLCFVVSILFSATLAFGDELNCVNPTAQSEYNQCSYKEYQAADKLLNNIWPKIQRKMRSVDANQEAHLKGAEKSLLTAQKAWITYKEKHCEVDGFAARGGTLEPYIISECLTKLTKNRTKELEDLLLGY